MQHLAQASNPWHTQTHSCPTWNVAVSSVVWSLLLPCSVLYAGLSTMYQQIFLSTCVRGYVRGEGKSERE